MKVIRKTLAALLTAPGLEGHAGKGGQHVRHLAQPTRAPTKVRCTW